MGKLLGIGLFAALATFLPLNLATAQNAICTDQECGVPEECKGDESCLEEIDACHAGNQNNSFGFCQTVTDNKNAQNDANKGDGVEPPSQTICKYEGDWEEPPPYVMCAPSNDGSSSW